MSDSTRRTLRTTVQTLLGLLAAVPLLADSGSLPATLPGLALAVSVSTTLTRLMALPGVEQLLPAWLRREQLPSAAGPAEQNGESGQPGEGEQSGEAEQSDGSAK